MKSSKPSRDAFPMSMIETRRMRRQVKLVVVPPARSPSTNLSSTSRPSGLREGRLASVSLGEVVGHVGRLHCRAAGDIVFASSREAQATIRATWSNDFDVEHTGDTRKLAEWNRNKGRGHPSDFLFIGGGILLSHCWRQM